MKQGEGLSASRDSILNPEALACGAVLAGCVLGMVGRQRRRLQRGGGGPGGRIVRVQQRVVGRGAVQTGVRHSTSEPPLGLQVSVGFDLSSYAAESNLHPTSMITIPTLVERQTTGHATWGLKAGPVSLGFSDITNICLKIRHLGLSAMVSTYI